MKTKYFVGILGGGQLAWLLNLSGQKFGVGTRVWDVSPGATGFQSASEIHCSPWDSEKGLEIFVRNLDFCTLEWESVPLELLHKIETRKVVLMPSLHAVAQASSRLAERELFQRLGFSMAPWLAVNSAASLDSKSWIQFWQQATFEKAYLKHDRGGYDGKGQMLISRETPLEAVGDFFSLGDSRGIVEAHADLAFEVSVIAARNRRGAVCVLGLFENYHENGVLRVSRPILPTDTRFDQNHASVMMENLLADTHYVGVAAIELFVEKSGKILANEWAPRVHNSGHLSVDIYEESQFDYHWRGLCDLDFKANPLKRRGLMVNVLADDISADPSFTKSALLSGKDPLPFLARHLSKEEMRSIRQVVPYDYQKKELKAGRKMGHLNVLF